MPPFNSDENSKQNENTSTWHMDEKKECWKLVNRKSSFSDINHYALRNARNSSKTLGYVKEFRKYLRNEKKRIQSVERQKRLQNRKFFPFVSWIWFHTFRRIKDDWLCLGLLGICMAFLSVGVDKGIELCSSGKLFDKN